MTQRTNGETHKLTEEEIREKLLEELGNPLGWWYLSFANDSQFLGGVIVEAPGFVTAFAQANSIGVNPGGQVMGIPVPADKVPPAHYHYRLLNLEELEECWGEPMVKLSEIE